MMSSIPWRSSVPGAIRSIDPSRRGSRRGSYAEGVRVKPRLLPTCLSVLSFIEPRLDRASKRVLSVARDLALGRGAGRCESRRQSELCALFEPPLGLSRRPQATGEADLAERGETCANCRALSRRGDRKADREICAGLVDAHAAGNIDEGVGGAERDASMSAEHGDDHRQPLGIDAGADAARHGEIRGRDERLDLEQDRPRSLQRAGDGGADFPLAAAEELRRVRYADEPIAGHLEDAELVGRAEAVLRRPQNTVSVVAVALELEHTIDEVLEH